MPKDRREAKIYYQSKLEEVGDLYFYFLFLQAGLVIVDGIELDKKRDTLSFLILLSTIVVTMVRIFAYIKRKSNWGTFMVHMIVLYVFNISRSIISAYLEFRELPETSPETAKFEIIDVAQRQITNFFALHVILLTPNFLVGMLYFFTFYL